jgi:hypothetical protein
MKTAMIVGALGLSIAAAVPPNSPIGKVLVLDNDQLIEGDIRCDSEGYTVRRGNGETTIPAGRVVAVVADRRSAFSIVRRRSNTHDFDERIRLVRWCMENDLRNEALAEVKDLLRQRPSDPALLALSDGLSMPPTTLQPNNPISESSDKVIEIAPPNFNNESFSSFVSRIQPILMNACASCHAAGKGGTFELVRVIDGGNRKAALTNLNAVLKFVDRTNPLASPLLAKSVIAHGTASLPPLRDRQSPAFLNLQAWVNTVAVEESKKVPVIPQSQAPDLPIKPEGKKTATQFGETSPSQPKPEVQTQARDPFDPAIFNGTIQPKK